MLKLTAMKEDQLEQLLRQRALIEAPQEMKASIMSQLPDRVESSPDKADVLPEKLLLTLSLVVGFLVVLFSIDLSFLSEKLWLATTSMVSLMGKNIFLLNKAVGFADKFPVYLLFITLTFATLLLLERMVLRRFRTKLHLFL